MLQTTKAPGVDPPLAVAPAVVVRGTAPALAGRVRLTTKTAKNNTHICEIQISDQPAFVFFYFIFAQSWYNGLDSDRFCGPEHIIQKSNSSFFLRC